MSCRCSGHPEPGKRERERETRCHIWDSNARDEESDGDAWRGGYQFGLLRIDGIAELQKSLELIVLSERDDLHDRAKFGENL